MHVQLAADGTEPADRRIPPGLPGALPAVGQPALEGARGARLDASPARDAVALGQGSPQGRSDDSAETPTDETQHGKDYQNKRVSHPAHDARSHIRSQGIKLGRKNQPDEEGLPQATSHCILMVRATMRIHP